MYSKDNESFEEVYPKVLDRFDEQLRRFRIQMASMREGPAKNNFKDKIKDVLKQKKLYKQKFENLQKQLAIGKEKKNFGFTSVEIFIDGIKQARHELKDQKVRRPISRYSTTSEIGDDELAAELAALGDEIVHDDD